MRITWNKSQICISNLSTSWFALRVSVLICVQQRVRVYLYCFFTELVVFVQQKVLWFLDFSSLFCFLLQALKFLLELKLDLQQSVIVVNTCKYLKFLPIQFSVFYDLSVNWNENKVDKDSLYFHLPPVYLLFFFVSVLVRFSCLQQSVKVYSLLNLWFLINKKLWLISI